MVRKWSRCWTLSADTLHASLWPERGLGRVVGLPPEAGRARAPLCLLLVYVASISAMCADTFPPNDTGAGSSRAWTTTRLLRAGSLWSNTLCALCIHAVSHLRWRSIADVADECLRPQTRVDGDGRRHGSEPDRRSLRTFTLISLIHAFCFPAMIALQYAMDFVPSVKGPGEPSSPVVGACVTLEGYFCSVVICAYVTQFSTLLLVLRKRFGDLNASLRALHFDATREVHHVRLEHMHWGRVAGRVDRAYSAQNLVLVSVYFFKCVRFAHTMLTGGSWLSLAYYLYVTLLSLLFVWYPCMCAHQATKESEKTSSIVIHIMNETSHLDGASWDELVDFSAQLSHSDVHWTAYSLFPVDPTLVYGVIGAATTYLVVLLQYEQGEQSTD